MCSSWCARADDSGVAGTVVVGPVGRVGAVVGGATGGSAGVTVDVADPQVAVPPGCCWSRRRCSSTVHRRRSWPLRRWCSRSCWTSSRRCSSTGRRRRGWARNRHRSPPRVARHLRRPTRCRRGRSGTRSTRWPRTPRRLRPSGQFAYRSSSRPFASLFSRIDVLCERPYAATVTIRVRSADRRDRRRRIDHVAANNCCIVGSYPVEVGTRVGLWHSDTASGRGSRRRPSRPGRTGRGRRPPPPGRGQHGEEVGRDRHVASFLDTSRMAAEIA